MTNAYENGHRLTVNERDQRLAAAWQQGSRESARILTSLYRPLIMKLAARAYRTEDHDDAVQDLAVTFLVAAREYDPAKNPSFAGYIKQRLYWSHATRTRKAQTLDQREKVDDDSVEEEGAPDRSPAETEDTLRAAARLARLTEKEEPLYQLLVHGKTMKEAAALLHTPERTLRRIRKSLREKLRQHGEEIRELMRE